MAMHFITQATSDIRRKLQKLEARLPTPLSIFFFFFFTLSILVEETFKVYSNQDLMEESNKDKGLVKKTILGCCDSLTASSGPWRAEMSGQMAKKLPGLEPMCLLS